MPQDNQPLNPANSQISLDDFEERVARSFGIPRGLREALKTQESGGNDAAVSYKGARGRYQVMPDTVKKYGSHLNPDDAFDQTYAGLRYLKEKYDEVDKTITDPGARWAAALAGYHGGERQIRNINRSGGQIASGSDGLTTTNKYVDSIMARWQKLSQQTGGQPSVTAQSALPQDGFNRVDMRAGDTMDLATGQITRAGAQARAQAPGKPQPKPQPSTREQQMAGLVEAMKARDFKPEVIAAANQRLSKLSNADFAKESARLGKILGTVSTEEATHRRQMEQQRQQYYAQPLYQQVGQEIAGGLARVGEGAQRAANRLLRPALEAVGLGPEVQRGRRGEEATAQKLAEQEEIANTLRSKVVRGGTAGASTAAIMAPLAMVGGAPAVTLATAAQQDWERDPAGALASTAGAAVPIYAGRAISPLATGAARTFTNPVTGKAVQLGIEGVAGAGANVGQYAATQKVLGRPIDPSDLAEQAITGGVLSAALAPGLARGRAGTPAPDRPAVRAVEQANIPATVAREPVAREAGLLARDYVRTVEDIRRTITDPIEQQVAIEQARAQFQEARRNQRTQPAQPQTATAGENVPGATSGSAPAPTLPDGVQVIRQGEAVPPRQRGFRQIPMDFARPDGTTETVTVIAPEQINGQRASETVLRPMVEGALQPKSPAPQPAAEIGQPQPRPQPATRTAGDDVQVFNPGEQPQYDPATQKAITFTGPDKQYYVAVAPKQMPRADVVTFGRSRVKPAEAAPVPVPDQTEPLTPQQPQPDTAQRLIDRTRQNAEDLIQQGRYDEAINELKAHQQALRDAKAKARKQPGERVRLERLIGQAGNRIGEVRAMAKSGQARARVENAPTEGLSTPLLESQVNPEGGVPERTEPLSGRFGQLARQQAAEQQQPQRGRKATGQLSPIEHLKRATGGEGIRVSDRGEARVLGAKEAGIVALTNRRSKFTANDAAVILDEGGFMLPDGRKFTDPSVTENDVLTFLSESGKQGRLGTAGLDQRIDDEMADFYENRPTEGLTPQRQVEPTGRIEQARAQVPAAGETPPRAVTGRTSAIPAAEAPAKPQSSPQRFSLSDEGRWDVSDDLGGRAYGELRNGEASITEMQSVPRDKKFGPEESQFKRRGFFRGLVRTLRDNGAQTLRINRQSSDTRAAVARLLESGELTNPRGVVGSSGNEHPTIFDIPAGDALAQPSTSRRLSESINPDLMSAYSKLDTDDPAIISQMLRDADKRFKKSATPQEQRAASQAWMKVQRLTAAERRALSEAIPERTFAPVREDYAGEPGENYSRAVSDIPLSEANPQLDKNLRDVLDFFDEMKATDTEVPKLVRDAAGRLKEAASGKLAGSGGQQLVDMAIVGGWKVYKAGMDFAEWSGRMVREFGEQVKPHLRAAWDSIQAGASVDAPGDKKAARAFQVKRITDADTPADKAANLRVRGSNSPLRAHITYGNEQAHDFLMRAIANVDRTQREEYYGLNYSLAYGKKLAKELQRMGKASGDSDIERTLTAFGQQIVDRAARAPDQRGLWVYVDPDANFSVRDTNAPDTNVFRTTRGLVSHEVTHSQEMLFPLSRRWFNKQQNAVLIAGALRARGYTKADDIGEAVAHIAGGQYKDINLTAEEGADFLAAYFDEVVRVHGADALGKFSELNFVPGPRSVLKSARERSAYQRDALRSDAAGRSAQQRSAPGQYSSDPGSTSGNRREFGGDGESLSDRRQEGAPRLAARKSEDGQTEKTAGSSPRLSQLQDNQLLTQGRKPAPGANYWKTPALERPPETPEEKEQTVSNVRGEFRQRPDGAGTLWTNEQGAGAIASAARQVGVNIPTGGFSGVAMSVESAQKTVNFLREKAGEYRDGARLNEMADLLDEAIADARANGQNRITIVDSTAGETLSDVKSTTREERFHRWQDQQGIMLGPEARALHTVLRDDPTYTFIREKLIEEGYPADNEGLLISEAAAKVASGQWEAYKLESERQGLDFLHRYYSTAARMLGPEVLAQDAPGTAAARRTLENVRELTGTGRLADRGDQGIQGGRRTRQASQQERNVAAPSVARGLSGGRGRGSEAPDGGQVSGTEPLTFRERLGRKIGAGQAIAQLGNPRTILQNVISNAAFSGAKNAATLAALPIDRILSAFSGQRQVSRPELKAQVQDFADGFADVWHAVKAGDYSLLVEGKFDLSTERAFKSKVGKFAEDVMDIALRGPDRGAYLAAYNDAVQQITKAHAKSKRPYSLDQIHEQAKMEAQQAVFQDDNFVSKFTVGLKKVLNQVSPFGEKANFGLADVVGLKYPRVPGGLVARAIEYSPAGFVKALYKGAKVAAGKGQGFDQREASLAFGKAFVGSAFGAGMGALLHHLGVIVAPEKEDRGVAAAERSEGLGGYQVNLSALKRYAMGGALDLASGDTSAGRKQKGDILMTYDWLQPWAFALGMGAAASAAHQKSGGRKQVMEDMLGQIDAATSTLADQSILRNIQDVFKYGLANTAHKAATDLPSSFVPAVLNQTRQIIDDRAREIEKGEGAKGMSREALDKVLNRLPVASKQLPERRDLVGRPAPSRLEGAAGAALVPLPGRFSEYRPNAVMTEMQRLGEGSTGPKRKPGESRAQFKARQSKAQAWLSTYGQQLIGSGAYKSATKEQRTRALEILRTRISKQSGEDSPNLDSLRPDSVITSAKESLRKASQ